MSNPAIEIRVVEYEPLKEELLSQGWEESGTLDMPYGKGYLMKHYISDYEETKPIRLEG